MELCESNLPLRYQSFCDPRLNFEQSLDLAFLISNHYKQERRARRRGKKNAYEEDTLYSALGGIQSRSVSRIASRAGTPPKA